MKKSKKQLAMYWLGRMNAVELRDFVREFNGLTMEAVAVGLATAKGEKSGAAFGIYLPIPERKIQAIKLIREFSGLGLREAKDLADDAPRMIFTGLTRAKAEEMAEAFQDAGVPVQIRVA